MLSLLEAIRPTTLIRSAKLIDHLGLDITIASETFQHTGSFKFRAAYNLALNVPNDRLLTASSGNFGQGLAYSAKLLGKQCTVVMPATSAQVKIDAVRGYGATVDLIDTKAVGRSERIEQLREQMPDAYVASPYDDQFVIDGNATLGLELLGENFDAIIVPIGGGGLISGTIEARKSGSLATPTVLLSEPGAVATGLPQMRSAECGVRNVELSEPQATATLLNAETQRHGEDIKKSQRLRVSALSIDASGPAIFGAEPLLGNDAARSFRSGQLIANETEPTTIADGARTLSLGRLNWPIIRDGAEDIIEVADQSIAEAVRLYFSLANLKCEPTGALSLGAILENKASFKHKKVCVIVSGGNVDPDVYRTLI